MGGAGACSGPDGGASSVAACSAGSGMLAGSSAISVADVSERSTPPSASPSLRFRLDDTPVRPWGARRCRRSACTARSSAVIRCPQASRQAGVVTSITVSTPNHPGASARMNTPSAVSHRRRDNRITSRPMALGSPTTSAMTTSGRTRAETSTAAAVPASTPTAIADQHCAGQQPGPRQRNHALTILPRAPATALPARRALQVLSKRQRRQPPPVRAPAAARRVRSRRR